MQLSWGEKRDWIRLYRTSTVGPVAFRDLLKRYKTAAAALKALPHIITKKSIRIPDISAVEAEMDAAHEIGATFLMSCEDSYPAYLKMLSPAPPVISCLGDISLFTRPGIAIIGSRNASAMGLRFARQLSHELTEMGYVIISGLARGIDASAHSAALSGGTVAVLGGGVDHIYPQQNRELYHAMTAQGCLVSESPIGYRATARDFPRRNRIISGLSRGVVVIEAAERSGTLITARYALEQNREVMAVPGSPLDPRAKGCNRLIQQGAALIETAEDVKNILEQLPSLRLMEPERHSYQGDVFDWQNASQTIETSKPHLLQLLSPILTPRDEIIRQSGLPIQIANAALLELELNADIISDIDGRIARNL
jgi:DNA processing protein